MKSTYASYSSLKKKDKKKQLTICIIRSVLLICPAGHETLVLQLHVTEALIIHLIDAILSLEQNVNYVRSQLSFKRRQNTFHLISPKYFF